MPKYFLWWSIPQYAYNWIYSNAYLEVLCMDTIILDFGNDKDNKKITSADYEHTVKVWEESQKITKERNGGAWGTVKNI